jgi:hypothetical protein
MLLLLKVYTVQEMQTQILFKKQLLQYYYKYLIFPNYTAVYTKNIPPATINFNKPLSQHEFET